MKSKMMGSSHSQIKEEALIIDVNQVNTDPSIIQRFFKVMIPGYHKKLILPPLICMKLKGKTRNGAVLTSRKGDWGVKISARANGKMYFKDGWTDFVEAHGLEFGDFIVFEHQGYMHFKVWVYDSSCCQKDFFLDVKEDPDVKDEHVEDEDAKDEDFKDEDVRRQVYESANTRIKRGRPRKISNNSQESREFSAKISHQNLTIVGLILPKIFVALNKLESRTLALLTGPSRKLCEVKLVQGQRGSVLREGWLYFCKENKIQEGDICLFKLTSPEGFAPMKMDVQVISAPN